jgi:hypothetical protein
VFVEWVHALQRDCCIILLSSRVIQLCWIVPKDVKRVFVEWVPAVQRDCCIILLSSTRLSLVTRVSLCWIVPKDVKRVFVEWIQAVQRDCCIIRWSFWKILSSKFIQNLPCGFFPPCIVIIEMLSPTWA